MRMVSPIGKSYRVAALIALIVLSVVLVSADSSRPVFTASDKAYYAGENLINFVRPGLLLKVMTAEVATDGTIKTRFKITDLRGLPLDRDGVVTPGAVSVSCVAAFIPKSGTQYTAYTTRVQTSPITNKSATQAGTDTNGTFEKVADGEYVYTFRTKAPSGYDRTTTHSVGCQSNRNLTEFDLGTNYDSDVLTFVPDGSKVTLVRDVIRNPSCDRCHDQLAFHGGSRRGIEYCVLCHQPQTVDPDTGNTVDMPVMVHKIHMGEELPSVQKGGKYSIIGFNQGETDYSTVAFPANPRRCETCHEQDKGATQAANYLNKPSRVACGACHDNVNFATGENHVDLAQVSDNQCAQCHTPQGELEFDASIKGAHVVETRSAQPPGINIEILKVTDGTAGKKPTITFTLKDDKGNPVPATSLAVTPNRVGIVLAGPTTDYGYTNFGSDVTTGGYVSENGATATCASDGTCTYTLAHAIPANAKGTFTIGIEARRGSVLNPGTKKEISSEYGAINKTINFSVDGSKLALRRKVVDIAKCNQCHVFLSLHGENRNQIEQCVLCHNGSETDKARRPVAVNADDKATPPQAIEFAYMVHRIHTGEKLKEQEAGYTVVGFGGSHNDFSEVRYPAFAPNGSVGDRRNCGMCHVDGSEGNLPTEMNAITNPQGPLNPMGAVAGACLGCHASMPAASHALAMTTRLGESCEACHGATADFSVSRAHAR